MPIRLKRYRKDFEHSYAFGVFATLELLQHRPDQTVSVLLHSKGNRNEGVLKIERLCARHHIRVEHNDTAIERLTNREDEYAVGVFRKVEHRLDRNTSHVVLVNPADMGNLGAIVRTMAAFGFEDLALIHPAVDAFDPRAVRASMGALFQVRLSYFDTFEDYRRRFGHALYPFITQAPTPLEAVGFARPCALIFGNESAGLPDEFRQTGTPVSIPITHRVDSLNLAVAVGIALHSARALALPDGQ